MTFNAEKHLIELQGKAYLEVKFRLVWFREMCPNGTIDTEEVLVDLDREVEAEVPTGNWIPNPNRPGKKMPEKMIRRDNGYARFRAVVTDGKGGRATATKSENAASFPDFIEKAETGAVGRALAMLGYGTQFTGDELNEEHQIIDAPVDRSQAGQTASDSKSSQEKAQGAKTAANADPTPTQLESLEKLAAALQKPVPNVESFAEAKDLIHQMQDLLRMQQRKAS